MCAGEGGVSVEGSVYVLEVCVSECSGVFSPGAG